METFWGITDDGCYPPPWRMDINPEITAAFCLGQLVERAENHYELLPKEADWLREQCQEREK